MPKYDKDTPSIPCRHRFTHKYEEKWHNTDTLAILKYTSVLGSLFVLAFLFWFFGYNLLMFWYSRTENSIITARPCSLLWRITPQWSHLFNSTGYPVITLHSVWSTIFYVWCEERFCLCLKSSRLLAATLVFLWRELQIHWSRFTHKNEA